MLFPTPMLMLSSHPRAKRRPKWRFAYNRWLVERVLSSEPRLRSMLYLPFHDPEAAYKMVLRISVTRRASPDFS